MIDRARPSDRVLSPTATEPVVSAHPGDAPSRGLRLSRTHKMSMAAKRRARAFVIRRDGRVCCYCGTELTQNPKRYLEENYATLEHVKPLGIGGSNHFENLRVSCRDCNMRRGLDTHRELQTLRATDIKES